MTGIILAAGLSRRMGSPKQLLQLGDKSILQHVVDAAQESRLGDIVLVLGHEHELISAGLSLSRTRVVINPDFANGQSTSIKQGVATVGPEATGAVVMLGDQPTISSEVIDRLIAEFEATGSDVVQPIYGDEISHPVLLARSLFPEIMLIDGDEGARKVVAEHKANRRLVPISGTAPPDVDDADDYQRLLDGTQEIRP